MSTIVLNGVQYDLPEWVNNAARDHDSIYRVIYNFTGQSEFDRCFQDDLPFCETDCFDAYCDEFEVDTNTINEHIIEAVKGTMFAYFECAGDEDIYIGVLKPSR